MNKKYIIFFTAFYFFSAQALNDTQKKNQEPSNSTSTSSELNRQNGTPNGGNRPQRPPHSSRLSNRKPTPLNKINFKGRVGKHGKIRITRGNPGSAPNPIEVDIPDDEGEDIVVEMINDNPDDLVSQADSSDVQSNGVPSPRLSDGNGHGGGFGGDQGQGSDAEDFDHEDDSYVAAVRKKIEKSAAKGFFNGIALLVSAAVYESVCETAKFTWNFTTRALRSEEEKKEAKNIELRRKESIRSQRLLLSYQRTEDEFAIRDAMVERAETEGDNVSERTEKIEKITTALNKNFDHEIAQFHAFIQARNDRYEKEIAKEQQKTAKSA